MRNIVRRFLWLIRRYQLAWKYPGFKASWRSYADGRTSFSEYNRLYSTSMLINSSIGRFTYVGGAFIKNSVIGSFCSIGPDTQIGGFSQHPIKWLSTHPAFYSMLRQCGASFVVHNLYEEEAKGARVGNDVWVGSRVLVLDGVTVGDGAVIAAGAVVTKDVSPYSIVGGIPAKVIRSRFASETIDELLRWQWWDLPVEVLHRLAPRFTDKEQWQATDIVSLRKEAEQVLSQIKK